MMITGRQIREARQKLGWSSTTLAARTGVPVDVIERAESTDDTPSIMLEHGQRLREVFEGAGLAVGRRFRFETADAAREPLG